MANNRNPGPWEQPHTVIPAQENLPKLGYVEKLPTIPQTIGGYLWVFAGMAIVPITQTIAFIFVRKMSCCLSLSASILVSALWGLILSVVTVVMLIAATGAIRVDSVTGKRMYRPEFYLVVGYALATLGFLAGYIAQYLSPAAAA